MSGCRQRTGTTCLVWCFCVVRSVAARPLRARRSLCFPPARHVFRVCSLALPLSARRLRAARVVFLLHNPMVINHTTSASTSQPNTPPPRQRRSVGDQPAGRMGDQPAGRMGDQPAGRDVGRRGRAWLALRATDLAHGVGWRGGQSEPERCMLQQEAPSCTIPAVRHASPRHSSASCVKLSHDRRGAGAIGSAVRPTGGHVDALH